MATVSSGPSKNSPSNGSVPAISSNLIEPKGDENHSEALNTVKGKEKSPLTLPEKYFTSRYASEIQRITATLGETRGGSKIFEKKGMSYILPSNWTQLVEEHNLWLLAEKCMEVTGHRHIYAEETLTLDVSSRESDSRFIDGLLISMEDKSISKTNWGTTSEMEKGRLEGQTRKAIAFSAASEVSWSLMKQSKASVSPTLNYTDSLYKRLSVMIGTKSHHQDVGMWLVKLFHSAQAKLMQKLEEKISDHVLSFDEVWSEVGDIKKDLGGKPKLDKSGKPKRYHPGKPDFPGMDKTEVFHIKDGTNLLWAQVEDLRKKWSAIQTGHEYDCLLSMIRKVYQAQVKCVKSVKGLADSRIEALGLPRTAPKSAISNRKAQRIATGDYKPMFGQHELDIIIVNSQLDLFESNRDFIQKAYGSNKPNLMTAIEKELAEANALKKKLLTKAAVKAT